MNPALLLGLALALTAAPADRPNVVFVLADDLGINDLGCYGRADQPTPNLDRLAREGTRFTASYCAQPICSPSRAAIMTGKTPTRVKITTFLPGRGDAPSQKFLQAEVRQQLPLEEVTIAERLKAAGYATACFGKWHLGGPRFGPDKQGFDVVHAGQANTTPSATEGGKGEYDLTRHAEQFIADNKDRPFFLYLPHNSPHIPLAAKADLIAEAKARGAFNPLYAAVVRTLDDTVGRLLAKLDELGLTGRTLFVFTSDNGGLHVLEGANTPATHNSPFRAGKGFVYEGGLRVPLIVRWPGSVPAGRVVDTPVVNTDWVPTLVDLCGAAREPSSPLDGVSLAGLLRGGGLAPRPLLWHFPHYTNQGSRPAGAVRDGDWKLVGHGEDDSAELYDLSRDPGEAHDLAREHPDRVAALRRKLAAWRSEVGAVPLVPNPGFDPAWHRRLYEDVDVSRLRPAATSAAMRPAQEAWRKGMNEVLRLPAKAAGR